MFDVLSQDDTDAIYAYILQRAHEDKTVREQEEGWLKNMKLWFYDQLASLLAKVI